MDDHRVLWRSPADAHWQQGGERCEVVERFEEGAEVLYRLRFPDGEEFCAPSDEVVLGAEAAGMPASVVAGQSALFDEADG